MNTTSFQTITFKIIFNALANCPPARNRTLIYRFMRTVLYFVACMLVANFFWPVASSADDRGGANFVKSKCMCQLIKAHAGNRTISMRI